MKGRFRDCSSRGVALLVAFAAVMSPDGVVVAAEAPVVFTTRQDHQNMLDQLGITRLRPGRNAKAGAPNAANYDEARANPHPDLPELLIAADGSKIADAKAWRTKRRPEVVAALEREVYGRIPGNTPGVKWEVRQTREVEAGGRAAVQKELIGVVDNAACPEIEVNISLSLTLPKDAGGPVPVLMSFGWTPFDMERMNFRGFGDRRGPSKRDTLLAAGWGCATLNPSTVQADAGGWQPRRFGPKTDKDAEPVGAGLTRGIIGLVNHGQPRKPGQWEPCAPGAGAPCGRWIAWRRFPRLMPGASASPAFRAMARRRWPPWRSMNASPPG